MVMLMNDYDSDDDDGGDGCAHDDGDVDSCDVVDFGVGDAGDVGGP